MISVFLFGKCISTPHNSALTLKLESLKMNHIFKTAGLFCCCFSTKKYFGHFTFHPSKTIIHENIFFFKSPNQQIELWSPKIKENILDTENLHLIVVKKH